MKQLKYLFFIAVAITFSLFTNNANAQHKTMSENHLNKKDRSIITISSYTAQGKLSELKTSLNAGLDAGLTVNEIKEILVHTYAYCGFPRSIRGLQTLMVVVQERKEKGINDTIGKEISPIVSDSTKYERGKKILGELTKMPQPDKLSGYSAFAPTMDAFLKEHLFADIFERDILSFAQRELITISVITAIGDAEPMLQSHLGISLNVGWSPMQLKKFISVISSTVEEKKSTSATSVLNQVLKNHKAD